MNKRDKILTAFSIMIILFSMTACDKTQSVTDESSTETSLDMDQALKDLDSYCSGHPVCIRLDSAQYPEQNIVYDFTDDGYDDLITGFTYGSGLVRNVIVVYDVANQVFYPIGDEYAHYKIESFEDGNLIVAEYLYPDFKRSKGTLELINNELVFVLDS